MESLFVQWMDSPLNQKVKQINLNGVTIWDGNENNPDGQWGPSLEHDWTGSASFRDIASSATVVLMLQFEEDWVGSGYEFRPTFDIGCSVSTTN